MDGIIRDLQEGKKLTPSELIKGYTIVFTGCTKNYKSYEDEYRQAITTFLQKNNNPEEFNVFVKRLNKVFQYPIREGKFDADAIIEFATNN